MPRPPILPLVDWKNLFEQGATYEDWLSAGESSENGARMEEERKNVLLEPATVAYLKGLDRPVYVLAIAEDWCGDVVRHVPVLTAMADLAPQLKVRFISRQQSPDTFVRFLTNGGEAIPKFIFLSDGFVECGNWGPMPARCREIIARGKACGDVSAARGKVAKLYEADHNRREVVAELLHHIDIAASEAP